jgi:DNA-binding winged helix-turn-helix (wHTH) protein
MRTTRQIAFDTFRLDLVDERLWQGGRNIRLGRKALAILSHLLSQPGLLVSKDDLLASAWPETAVSDAALTTAMRELRQALGDVARIPRFIETVHGRGYRFIAPVLERTYSNDRANDPGALVGRDRELDHLREWHAGAREGSRRIAFVTGEAGIGKTALVNSFLSEMAERGGTLVARGQCIEQYGAGEAYLPILEALGRLGRNTPAAADVLRDHAGSWLPHLPSLTAGEPPKAMAPAMPARMLRELADALEILTARNPMILVVEDVHWSDTATLEWLAYAARRRVAARLLVLTTFRSDESHLHPTLRNLLGQLHLQPQCARLELGNLAPDAVEAYVRRRCGELSRLPELADALRRRTGGHPLFLTAIVDELLRQAVQGQAAAVEMAELLPAGVRQFIEHRIEGLSVGDREVLEAASVAGDPFSIAAVAAACDLPKEAVEERCALWARDGRFIAAGSSDLWPDGTSAARYRFRHALYQEVLYSGIPLERRSRSHRAVGRRLEAAWQKRAAAIAAELAIHFEQGGDARRAIYYREQAARNALDRSAYSEARNHLEQGQKLLSLLPEGRTRLRRELDFSLLLGRVLAATKGWAVPEVESLFLRSRELSAQLRDTPRLLQTLWGLIGATFVGAEFVKARTIGREVLRVAARLDDPVYAVLGHMEVGGASFHLGESGATIERHFAKAEAVYQRGHHRRHIAAFGVDMGVFSRSWSSHYTWHTGYPDRARAKAKEAVSLARSLSHPLSCAVALAYAAMLHQFCRDTRQVDAYAEQAIRLCTEHGFRYYLAWAEVLRGWSRAVLGDPRQGIADIRTGIEVLQATAGARLPYYRGLMAQACIVGDRPGEALEAAGEGLREIQRTEERWWEADLHRLRGEALLAMSCGVDVKEAESCFHRSITVARGPNSKSLELRGAVSLAQLWRNQGRRLDARRLVQPTHDWFHEGFDLPDLRAAALLLEEIATEASDGVA